MDQTQKVNLPRLDPLKKRKCCQRIDLKGMLTSRILIIYPNNSTRIWDRKKGFAEALHIFLLHISFFFFFLPEHDMFVQPECLEPAVTFSWSLNSLDELIHSFCFPTDFLWDCSNQWFSQWIAVTGVYAIHQWNQRGIVVIIHFSRCDVL